MEAVADAERWERRFVKRMRTSKGSAMVIGRSERGRKRESSDNKSVRGGRSTTDRGSHHEEWSKANDTTRNNDGAVGTSLVL